MELNFRRHRIVSYMPENCIGVRPTTNCIKKKINGYKKQAT